MIEHRKQNELLKCDTESLRSVELPWNLTTGQCRLENIYHFTSQERDAMPLPFSELFYIFFEQLIFFFRPRNSPHFSELDTEKDTAKTLLCSLRKLASY